MAVQIVDDLLCIVDRRRLVATREQLACTLHQLLLPDTDHIEWTPSSDDNSVRGLLSRQRRHRAP